MQEYIRRIETYFYITMYFFVCNNVIFLCYKERKFIGGSQQISERIAEKLGGKLLNLTL